MATIITLKHPGECSECGAYLPPGTKVRYYGRNGMYGLHCHPRKNAGKFIERSQPEREERFNTPCGHEDYPCCGCSDEYNQRFG